ncbi:MAG: TnpV protein, partial [Lachnospiraceae bacterium]|nr:TnpV protein [Lachnospiraceae bacterium]
RMNTYISDINEQETKQMLLLTKQMAECEGVTEQFKEQDQMLWVQRMNNIRHRTMAFVNHELIYA